MAAKAPLQDVVRRLQELRSAGSTAQEAAGEIQAMGWAPAEVKARLSTLRPAGTADAVAQGASFGFADEIGAGLMAPVRALKRGQGLGDAYSSGLEERRAALELAKSRSPVAMGASEIAGGLVSPGAMAGAAKTLGGAVAKGVGIGAGTGALYGAGTGEGVDDRLNRAMIGTAFGGATGGAIPLAAGVGRGASVRSPAQAGNTSRAMLAEALADEGLTGTQAAQRIADANKAGKTGITPMDVATPGGRVHGLGEDIINSPNPMQPKITAQLAERQVKQYDRLLGDLGELSGVGKSRAIGTLQEIASRRQADATPAFEKAWKFDTAADPEVRTVFREVAQTPLMKKAWGRAIDIAQSRARGVPTPKLAEVLDEAGEPRFVPDMRFMHFLKEGMDDAVNAAFKAGDGHRGAAFKEVRNLFRDTLKAKNPAYGQAMDQFAGEMALKEAVETGASTMLKSPDELQAAMQGLSGSELEAFRIGALTKVIDTLGNKRPGPTADIAAALTSPNFVRKVLALMPDEAARKAWAQRLGIETAMSGTARLAGNSATARRLAASEAMEGDEMAGRILGDAVQGMNTTWAGMFVAGLQKISKPVATWAKRARREAMGEALTKTDKTAQAFLRALDQRPPPVAYPLAGRLAAPAAVGLGQLAPDPDPEVPLVR